MRSSRAGPPPALDAAPVTQAQFLAFYDTSVNELFAYLFRATGGDRHLAEDLAQDVFTTALERARRGDAEVLTIAWAITVGRNRLIDHWRRAQRESHRVLELHPSREAPETEVEDGGSILGQVQALPPLQQAAVTLHYLDGFPVAEVGRQLGKSLKATESLLSRARTALRAVEGGHRV